MHLPHSLGCETFILPIPFADHSQRRRLHAAERIRPAPGGYRNRLRGVDAHQPVGLAAGFGRVVEIVVLVAALDAFQPLTNRLVRERADPKAVERRSAADVFVQVAENQLALASRIRRHDDALAFAEQPCDDLDLGHRLAVRLVALIGLDLSWHKLEDGRDDRQVIAVKSLDAVTVRQGGLHQMTESPSYIILRSGVIADLAFARFHDAGYFPRHARLLCNNSFHVRFILLWI